MASQNLITGPCPHCGQELQYDPSMTGVTLECPHCAGRIILDDPKPLHVSVQTKSQPPQQAASSSNNSLLIFGILFCLSMLSHFVFCFCHLWATLIAFTNVGFLAAVATFFTPPFSDIYWVIRCWGVIPAFCWTVIASASAAFAFKVGYWIIGLKNDSFN